MAFNWEDFDAEDVATVTAPAASFNWKTFQEETPSISDEDVSLRTGVGIPLTKEQAAPLARRRLIERERRSGKEDLVLVDEGTPQEQVGVLGQGLASKIATAVVEASRFPTFGAGPALAKVMTQLAEQLGVDPRIARSLSPEELISQNPGLAKAAETAGIIPAGFSMKGLPLAKSGLGKLAESLGIGASTLAASGAASQIEREGVDTTLPEAIRASIAATGSTVPIFGVPIPALALGSIPETASVVGASTRGISRTAQESALKEVQESLLAGGGTREIKERAAQLAPEILKKPFSETFAFTKKGLESKAGAKREIAGEAIDSFGKLKGEVDPKKIVDALENEKGAFIVEGKVIDPAAIQNIEGMQQVFSQFGDSISKEGLRQIRRTFDTQIAKSKGHLKQLSEASVLDLKKTSANEIREILAAGEPNLAKLNKQYSFWAGLDDVITETNKRIAPQRGLIAPMATIIGAASGTGLADMATRAIVFRGIAKATQSPGWKLTSARVKNNLADAISVNDLKKVFDSMRKIPGFDPATIEQALSAESVSIEDPTLQELITQSLQRQPPQNP